MGAVAELKLDQVAEGGFIELALPKGCDDGDEGSFKHTAFLPVRLAHVAVPTKRD
jgi:hypothetical protein